MAKVTASIRATPLDLMQPSFAPSIKRAGSPLPSEEVQLTTSLRQKVGNSDDREAFIECRFRYPMDAYRARSHIQATLYTVLNLTVAAGGLATAAIVTAGGDTGGWKIAVAVIGLVVGVLSVINQIRRPGQRNAVYARTWAALRTEGWEYVLVA
jgi:Protein of unknown function (DUF4231)